MRRWFTRITLGVVALLVAIVVIVQVALWTNLPRRIVLGQLQQQLGLRVSADSLSTNWLGHTSLSNVTLSLPIAKDAFLTVPTMRVRHTSIPMLLFKRSVTVDSIALDQPQLTVVRDAAGRWNFNEVIELIARTGGSENTPTPTAPPKLPKITVGEATVVINDNGGKTATIEHLNLAGQPDGALVWRYDLSVPDHVSLKGQVVPGGEWRHQVDVSVQNIAPWIKPWSAGVPQNTSLAASWDGRVTDGSINGTLGLQQFSFGKVDAKGRVAVRQISGGPISLEPQGLVVKTGNQTVPEAKFASGRMFIDPTGLRTEKLVFTTEGGTLRTDVGYTFASSAGDFRFAWEDLLIPSLGIKQFSGTLEGKVSASLPDRPQITAKLATRGHTPDGDWESTLAIDGAGKRGWSDMGWTVNADDLEWRGDYPISLDGMKAKLLTTPDPKTGQTIIRVASLERPNHPAEATGEFDTATGLWKLYVSIGGPNGAAKAGEASSLFLVNASGDPDHIQLDQFLARGPGAELWAKGTYVYAAPKPVDLDVYLNLPPNGVAMVPIDTSTTIAPVKAASPPTTAPAVAAAAPPVSGWLRGELHLSGTGAAPRDLTVGGKLIGKNVAVNGHPLGDIVAKVQGRIDNRTVTIATKRLRLLEGEWDLAGTFTEQNKTIDLEASVTNLPLKAAAQIVRRTDVDGVADGKWKVHIPRFDLNVITVDGSLAARDVMVAGVGADRLEAKIAMDKGRLNIDPIKAHRKITRPTVPDGAVAAVGNGAQLAAAEEKSVEGELTAALHFAVATPKQISGSIALKNWPQEIGTGAWFDISGGIPDLMVDGGAPANPAVDATIPTYGIPPTLTLNGKPNFTADFSWRGQHIGTGTIDGDLLGREVELKTVAIESIHGNLHGTATLNADYKLQSKAAFAFDNLNAELVADLFPVTEGTTGMFFGNFGFEPSKDKRAIEPLTAHLNVFPVNAHYGATDIGPVRLTAFTNLKRVVLSDPANVPSTIQVAGGVIELWGRFSAHDVQTPVGTAPKGPPSRDVLSTQMTIRLRDISLDQLVHTGAPEAKPMPGKLHADLTMVGSTRTSTIKLVTVNDLVKERLERLSKSVIVEGNVRITDSNLANFSVFSALYGLMNIGQDTSKPTGSGDVAIRLEGGQMYLDNLRYFNAGTEIRAIAKVDQVWMIPESKLSGTATGSARPLANMKVPFLADLDTILTVVQANVTNVAVDGTVHNPKVRPVTFDEIGTDLRAMVLGDAKK